MFIKWQNLENSAIESGELTKFNYDLFHYSSTITTKEALFFLRIIYNQQGIVKEFSITKNETLLFEGYNHNGWVINGDTLSHSESIYFIDISLTPFTNTLPITFLKYYEKTEETFPVLFFDVINQRFSIYHQTYTLIEEKVKYENNETSYINHLTIDKNNLVQDYPDAFIRVK